MHPIRRSLRLVPMREDAWMPDTGPRLRQLKHFRARLRGESGITGVDEEIDVLCSRKRHLRAVLLFQ